MADRGMDHANVDVNNSTAGKREEEAEARPVKVEMDGDVQDENYFFESDHHLLRSNHE